jgi:hypothetical protein
MDHETADESEHLRGLGEELRGEFRGLHRHIDANGNSLRTEIRSVAESLQSLRKDTAAEVSSICGDLADFREFVRAGFEELAHLIDKRRHPERSEGSQA